MKNSFLLIALSLLFVNIATADEVKYKSVFSERPSILENVKLHGDVRAKWKSVWGGVEEHTFKTEATLGCDYTDSDAWLSVKTKAATSNGKESLIFLDKAFLGKNVYSTDNINIAVEIGRNKMDSMFDSKMQFDSYFNGCHIIYTFEDPQVIDFKLHGGPHLVDSKRNHYGWIAEAVWNRIAGSPITVKYSFTDWNAPYVSKNERYWDTAYLFAISQLTAILDLGRTTLYGAYLYNHQEDRYNDGFYLGFKVGQLSKPHDFLFDVNFQSVKPLLLCQYDNKGLKKGIELKTIYAMTDSVLIEAKFSLHDAASNKKLELQTMYTW